MSTTGSVIPGTSGDLWLRQARLIVWQGQSTAAPSGAKVPGLDLSQFHFRFHVESSDYETPNVVTLRVYNLAPETIQAVVKEYNWVSLEAGYQQQPTFGMIFNGSIRRFNYGKETTTDNFLEIIAGDNDIGYNYGWENATMDSDSADVTAKDVYLQAAAAMGLQPDPQSIDLLNNSGVLYPRGKVLFNLARSDMRELAASVKARWSAQNGVLILIAEEGQRKGSAIAIGPETGLVGIPEATDNGVVVKTLLNPNLAIGGTVKIKSDLIVQTTTLNHFRPDLGYVAVSSTEDLYRVMSIEHTGDTRGQEWYSDIVCLAINPDQSAFEQANPNFPL
jgi:hypothetical protein